MKAQRYIIHNPTIQSYQLEEYHNHYRKLDQIETTKANIFKGILMSKQQSDQRFQMLQHTSKFNKQQQQLAMNKLQKLLDDKIDKINKRDNPFFQSRRSRAQSQIDFKSSPHGSFHFPENISLMKRLSQLKPNISKKDLDIQFEQQQKIASRIRKPIKLPHLF